MSDKHLFYIHDPMCSWCYAFMQCWTALQKELPVDLPVSYLLGGLAFDSSEPMPKVTQNMVQQAWRQIEDTVPGVQFNFNFWKLNIPYRSTYPSCRAVLAAKRQDDQYEQEMIRVIQLAYYRNAKNPSLVETLQECAEEVGLDVDRFIQDLNSPAIKNDLLHEVQSVRQMKVFSFPSLRLELGGKLFPISIDYLDHKSMLSEINQLVGGDLDN